MASTADRRTPQVPPANRGMQIAAGVVLVIPIIALMWVSSYSKVNPKLGAFPFFIWYQMLWVIITAGCTTIAYQLVKRARPRPTFTRDEVSREERRDDA